MSVWVFLKLLYPLFNAGEFDLTTLVLRGLLTHWLIVGIQAPPPFALILSTHPSVPFLWKNNNVASIPVSTTEFQESRIKTPLLMYQ